MPNPGRNPDEASPTGFVFGGYVLDLARGALLRGGVEIRLRAKSLDVLAYLVRHPGRLIAKRELMDAIWADVAVTDDSLVQCLVEIRRALGDDQAWVHTARGRGYRFDGEVQPILAGVQAAPVPDPAPTVAGPAAPAAAALHDPPPPMPARRGAPRSSRRWSLAAAVLAVVSVSAAGWWLWRRGPPPPARTSEAAREFAEGERRADRRSRESLARAIDAYERAIALDPAFAPAHAALANTLVVQGVYGGSRPDQAYPRALAAALRAVELDPMLAEAHDALGHVRMQWGRDWRGAEESYRRALALDPHAPRAHMLYALFLSSMGRTDESLRESQTALALRPESPTISTQRAIVLFLGRRPDEAIAQGTQAIRLDPAFSLPHFWQALALAEVGRFDEAMHEALGSRAAAGNLPAAVVGYIHGRAGRPKDALEVFKALEAARARSIYVPATDLALVAVGMGDREAALTWLERGFDERAHWMGALRTFPPFDPLRDEPRFRALVARMQFP